jgi:hypothetical protein
MKHHNVKQARQARVNDGIMIIPTGSGHYSKNQAAGRAGRAIRMHRFASETKSIIPVCRVVHACTIK